MREIKRIAVCLFALCAAFLLAFTGCQNKNSAVYSVSFLVDNSAGGGHIEGRTEQLVKAGNTAEAVRAVPDLGYKFLGWSNGAEEEELLFVPEKDGAVTAKFGIDALGLPVIEINTQNGAPVLDKETYVPCAVWVSNTEEEFTLNGAEAKIKGRGNTTWQLDKKPYKIKFSQKTDLFGFGKAKSWVLLADWFDGSMLRNRLAMSCGSLLGLEETSCTQPVELYLNGRYDGVYLLCEQTETGSTRVDISEEIGRGDGQAFLLELDNRAPYEGKEGLDYFVLKDDLGTDKYYAVKSPETDEAGYDESVTANISRILGEIWNTVCTGSWAEIENAIDTRSFAATCIVHQLFKTYDAVAFSWYVFRDAAPGSKLKSGPIWDFDMSVGIGDAHPEPGKACLVEPEALWPVDETRANRWYIQLLKHEEFKDIIREMLAENKEGLVRDFEAKAEMAKECKESYYRNYERWHNLCVVTDYTPEEIRSITTWEGHVEFVIEYLKKSLGYIIRYYDGTLFTKISASRACARA